MSRLVALSLHHSAPSRATRNRNRRLQGVPRRVEAGLEVPEVLTLLYSDSCGLQWQGLLRAHFELIFVKKKKNRSFLSNGTEKSIPLFLLFSLMTQSVFLIRNLCKYEALFMFPSGAPVCPRVFVGIVPCLHAPRSQPHPWVTAGPPSCLPLLPAARRRYLSLAPLGSGLPCDSAAVLGLHTGLFVFPSSLFRYHFAVHILPPSIYLFLLVYFLLRPGLLEALRRQATLGRHRTTGVLASVLSDSVLQLQMCRRPGKVPADSGTARSSEAVGGIDLA